MGKLSDDFSKNSEVKRWQMPEVGAGFAEDENYQRGRLSAEAKSKDEIFIKIDWNQL